MAIHPTAVIDPKAELDTSVEVGAYAIVDGPVRIGPNTRLFPHAYVSGWTTIGERCELHPFSVVGHTPQDFHHSGERSYCRIGNGVIIREGVSIHRGTQPESVTEIGDDCFFLASSHVGHNCRLGRGVKVLPFVGVAGHVEIDDAVILSAGSLIHQFVRIGKLAYTAANARVAMDVPPFMMCHGESTIVQHNVIGMRRAGYDTQAAREIRRAYHTLYRDGLLFSRAIEALAGEVHTDAGRLLVEFLQAPSKRGICGGTKRRPSQDGLVPE
jgi:UDP-N-acetylglucosamine acyltransferase